MFPTNDVDTLKAALAVLNDNSKSALDQLAEVAVIVLSRMLTDQLASMPPAPPPPSPAV
jgi:hypothetical protein